MAPCIRAFIAPSIFLILFCFQAGCQLARAECALGDLGCQPEFYDILYPAAESDLNELVTAPVSTPSSTTPASSALRVFVTLTDHPANFGGPTAADAACMGDANYPGSGTFKAILVSGTTRRACTTANCTTGGTGEHIDWVLAPSQQYERVDGTIIMTTDANGVFDFGGGNLTNSWAPPGGSGKWTGLNADWTNHISHCSNWSDPVSGQGARGSQSSVLSSSISAAPFNCTGSQGFYCVEQ